MSIRRIIAVASMMFVLSYIWHGLILTDLYLLKYPVALYLTISAIVYLVIAVGINYVYQLEIFYSLTSSKILNGLFLGLGTGLLLFMVSIVTGVSFAHAVVFPDILLDLSWQLFEQGIAGLAIGVYEYALEKKGEFEWSSFD